MEVDGSRLLYLESCEGLVESLKEENEKLKQEKEQLNKNLEFIKMAYQSSLSENTKLKSIIESQNKTHSKIQSDLWRVEADLSIAEKEATQLKDEYEQLKESRVFLESMYDVLNDKRSAYEEEITHLKEELLKKDNEEEL